MHKDWSWALVFLLPLLLGWCAELTAADCAPPPTNMLAWWPAEGHARDVINANDGTLFRVGYGAGLVGQAFSFPPTNASFVRINGLRLTATNEFSLELWYKYTGRDSTNSYGLIANRLTSLSLTHYGVAVYPSNSHGLQVWFDDPNVGQVSLDCYPPPAPGVFHHVAATFRQLTANDVELSAYIDGQLANSTIAAGNLYRSSGYASDVTIGRSRISGEGAFEGLIDEVSLYRRVLSSSEVQAIYNAGSAGKCFDGAAPKILQQPVLQVGRVTDNVTFSVSASGTAPLSYQWCYNGTNIPGANGSSYTINNVQLPHVGDYSVLITNSYGVLTSSNAHLFVGTLDQALRSWDTWFKMCEADGTPLDVAQTFTAAASGRLIEIDPSCYFFVTLPLTATIVDTINGSPGTNVLGRVFIPQANTERVFFANQEIYLVAGQSYAFLLNSEQACSAEFRLADSFNDNYPAGQFWKRLPGGSWQPASPGPNPVDMAFTTYMIDGTPSIRIAEPKDGSIFQNTNTIQITAILAPETTGPCVVSFYQDSNVIGTASQAPYTVQWANPPEGNHAITAVATLSSSNVTSKVVSIQVIRNNPANDQFADRVPLSGEYCQTIASNLNATLEAGEPRRYSQTSGKTVWWTWTAPRTAWVTFAALGSVKSNVVLGVSTGRTVDALLVVTNGIGSCSFLATTGQNFQLWMDSLTGSLDAVPLVLTIADLEITSPARNTVVTAPVSLTLQTARTATNRTITRVEFYCGQTLVGTRMEEPYTLTFDWTLPGYYGLRVQAYDALEMATVSQVIPITVRPANDNFENAIPIFGYSTNIHTSNLGATMQGPRGGPWTWGGEPSWAENQGGHSIWYRWTAPQDGVCTIGGQGTNFGLLLGAYLGSTVSNQTLVAANAMGLATPVSFQAAAGTTYNIDIDGFFGEEGELDWGLVLRPLNDDFANRTQIDGTRYQLIASHRGATLEMGESRLTPTSNVASVWWTWRAPLSGAVTVLAGSANAQTRVCIYTNSSLATLGLLASSGSDFNTNASISFLSQEGTAYQIAVFGDPQQIADFTFSLNMQTLRLLNPLDGSTYGAPARLLLNAQLDWALTVPTHMYYYTNDYLLASIDQPPFTYAWEKMPPGTYRLKAVCTLPGGVTNSSLTVTILVYTNNDLPAPRIFAGPLSSCSYVINSVGSLYVLGNAGNQYGLNPNEDLYHPRLAQWPAGVTRWQTIHNGWALTPEGALYQNGVSRIPFPTGVQRWLNLGQPAWVVGDNGRVYSEGQTEVMFAVTGQTWASAGNGYGYSASLTSDGRLYFHGKGSYGEAVSSLITFPTGVTRFLALQAGHRQPFALGDDGNIYYGTYFGVGYTGSLLPTYRPAGVTNWTAFSAGGYHMLAIGSDGQLYSWGRNWEGQLGIGVAGDDRNYFNKVTCPPGVTAWTSIAAGYMHSLAIGNDGALYAWGSADNGQLGIGRVSVAQLLPVRVNNLGALWGIPIISTGNDSTRLPDGSFRLRFKTDLNRTYQIQYSDDTETWKTASSMLTGNGQTLEWIDDGPPKTDSSPANQSTRFYRVVFAY